MSLSYGLSSKTMESASASSLQNPDFNSDYLLIFFDINRGGFFDVAQKILQFLDYKSLVMFKRTCKSVYEFLSANCDIEKVSKKCVKQDWKFQSIARDNIEQNWKLTIIENWLNWKLDKIYQNWKLDTVGHT